MKKEIKPNKIPDWVREGYNSFCEWEFEKSFFSFVDLIRKENGISMD